MVFLSGSRQIQGQYLKLRHYRFLPDHFQFIIYLSCFHFTLYSLSY